MTLDEAIAKIKEVTPQAEPWKQEDLQNYSMCGPNEIDQSIAVILNAVVSGELKK